MYRAPYKEQQQTANFGRKWWEWYTDDNIGRQTIYIYIRPILKIEIIYIENIYSNQTVTKDINQIAIKDINQIDITDINQERYKGYKDINQIAINDINQIDITDINQ